MKIYDKLYIGGVWREGCGDAVLTNVNPYTGQTLYTYRSAGEKDIDDAYAAAAAAQKKWSRTTVAEKTDAFEKLLGVMRARAPQIEECLLLEGGSTLPKRKYEAATCAQMVRYFMQFPARAEGTILPSEIPGAMNYVFRKPKGVVTVIAPWNVPCLLALKSILPAVALGNAVVMKPSSETPASALLLAEIFEQAEMPAGLLNVVVGSGAAIGDRLVTHPQCDLVSFTGSTQVGKRIASLAGQRICDVSLELGGNNAMLLLEDADLDAASDKALFGGYFHQGQICMGLNRIVVVGDSYDAFCALFAKKVQSLKAGSPESPDTFVGPLINRDQVRKFEETVQTTVRQGARVLVEGRTEGQVVHPWLLSDVTQDMAAASGEVFGPLCCVMRASSEQEAIGIVNNTTYGLSNSVFGRDLYHAMDVASRLESGMVHINDQPIGEEFHVMFGGEKQSGVGRFNGKWVLDKFTTEQWLAVNR